MENVTESDTTITTDLVTDPSVTSSLFTMDTITYDTTEETNVSLYNTFSNTSTIQNEVQLHSTVFEIFTILEIVMTAVELLLSTVAAIKIKRWIKNFRNQMLMQLSVARFIKRLIFLLQFMREKSEDDSSNKIKIALLGLQIYIDFVIIILVNFFIKHMYDTLIIVIVKISKNNLYSVLYWSWLLPIPVSSIWTVITSIKLLDEWMSYFLICLIFRWPLILLGTLIYLTVLYNVMTDKIRKFARSLTVVTFFLCLVVNFYLFSKDVIKLWCFESFSTILVSYILGFTLNFLILCFYVILIMLNFKSQDKSCKLSLPTRDKI